jgi:hypothetical protein
LFVPTPKREAAMSDFDRYSREPNSKLADALMGAVAGAIGVWALDRVDWYLYNRERPETRRRTQAVRPRGMDPAHLLANQAAEALGMELSPRQPHPVGIAVHYAIGIVPAALYGALLDDAPALGAGRGSLYGLSVFVIHDEILNPALGLAARPADYPWQDHARGFAAHLAYGLVTHAVLGMLKGFMEKPQRARLRYDYRSLPRR